MSRKTKSPPKGGTAAGRWVYGKINPRGITNAQLFYRLVSTGVVTAFGWALLFIPGLNITATTNVTYPTMAHWQIFWINLAFIASVVLEWGIYRGRRPSQVAIPLFLLGVLLILPLLTLFFLFTGPLLGFMVDWGTATAVWAWKLTGMAALLVNGWIVWRIWGLGDKNTQFDRQTAKVEQLNALLTPAALALADADGKLTAAIAVEADAKIELDKTDDALNHKKTGALKVQEKAQKAFDKVQKPKLDAEKLKVTDAKKLEKARKDLLDSFDKKPANVVLKTTDLPKYTAARDPLENDLTDATSAVTKAELALKVFEKKLKKTVEGKALKAANDAVKAAQKANDDAQTAHNGAKRATATARAAHKAAKDVVDKRDKELESARQGLTKQQAAIDLHRNLWIGVTILLVILDWVLYSAWPGWVLEAYNHLFGA